jgi:hypothetical protein
MVVCAFAAPSEAKNKASDKSIFFINRIIISSKLMLGHCESPLFDENITNLFPKSSPPCVNLMGWVNFA